MHRRVWLGKLPRATEAHQHQYTGWQALGQIESVLRHRGEREGFEWLSVYSGDAFHIGHAAGWRSGELHLLVPTDPLANVARAYGYRGVWEASGLRFWQMNALPPDEKRSRLAAFHEQLYRQIDAGRPPLVGGAYGKCGEWRPLSGYDARQRLICYAGGAQGADWVAFDDDPKVAEFGFWDAQVRGATRPGFLGGWQSNVAFLLGEREAAVAAADRLLATLRLAVALAAPRPSSRSPALSRTRCRRSRG